MNKKTNFFERLMELADTKGIKNPKILAEFLGYGSAEKIYRLKRNENANPSVEMIVDISNNFENVDLNWLLTGKEKHGPY